MVADKNLRHFHRPNLGEPITEAASQSGEAIGHAVNVSLPRKDEEAADQMQYLYYHPTLCWCIVVNQRCIFLQKADIRQLSILYV